MLRSISALASSALHRDGVWYKGDLSANDYYQLERLFQNYSGRHLCIGYAVF